MSLVEILTLVVAILGAGAWLPHVLIWNQKRKEVAKVVLVPDGQVQIGYTTYGSMFNLNLALASSIKDIIIKKIKATIRHEDGDTHYFVWQGLSETMSEISNTSGEKIVQTKDQAAIALKLITTTLIEKFVRFQEIKFKQETQPQINTLYELALFYKNNKETTAEAFEEVMKRKEFYDLISFFKSNSWWKVGKYSVNFLIESMDKHKFDQHTFNFELRHHDIEELKKNIPKIEKLFEYIGKGDFESITKELNFHWINVDLIQRGI